MTSYEDRPRELIWATRGRSWGFRFLLSAGLPDPLPTYEFVFGGLAESPVVWSRVGERAGLRFPDPLQRRDEAGRVIPHEFVLLGSLASAVSSADQGITRVWPLVERAYARVWDRPGPPVDEDLGLSG